jgi:signal transduction histidine kinase/streptogramin lyase
LNIAGHITRGFFLYLVLPVTLGVSCLFGQLPHSIIEYTTENGLSLNSVNDLHFDRQGFLWITTADGLQRFDGYRFQTFRHDPSAKKSIAENSVSSIYEDQDGNLWITHRTGICFKPKGKNEFIELSIAILDGFPLMHPPFCVNETDTSVWVINILSGLYAVNKKTLQVKKIFSLPENFNSIVALTRIKRKGDKLWFRKSTDKSGDLYRVTDKGIVQHPNKEKRKIHFLIPGKNDSLVIIADKIVYKALAKNPFTPVKITNAGFDAVDFQNEFISTALKIANDQHLLKGINNTWLYDGTNESINPFPAAQYFSGDLTRYLSTSAADDHKNSWIGFNGIGGIKVISVQKFNLFNRPEKNALPYTLTGDKKGNVYAGIYLGDIEVYDKEGRFIKKINLPEEDKKFGSPRAMMLIDSSTLIVKSTLHKLYAINIHNGSIQSLTHLLPRSESSSRVFELGIQQIRDGELWYSYTNSIYSLKKNKNDYAGDPLYTLPEKELINTFLFTGKQCWIGTTTGAWLCENNHFSKLPLPPTYVKHINQHPDGSIWIATTFGLYIVKDKKIIKHLNIKDGLPNSFIYSIVFDNEGNGWISSNRGLAKISPPTAGDSVFTITSYSAREGLQGDEFNTKGYYKNEDGTLYFAGVNGINFFKPDSLIIKSGASPIMLTGIEVNNQPYLPNLQPEFFQTISLPYRQNNLRLSFSCMDFTVPEKNQYKFWLKGFQDDWTLPQTNNTVQYILPVGEYELHVLGANYEGVWSKEPLILKINILPPWYQTTWAKTIFAILILTFVAAIFYFISRNRYQKKLRQLQMEQEIQKEKQRLSRDLHDNLGSQLTWLSNNIAQLEIAQQEQKPIEQKLETLKEGTGELMQTLRETIWILNKDKISCVDLFDKVVSLAARHIEAYPPMQLQTEEKIQSIIALNSGQALQIFRICQEAINNAFKHSQATILSIKATSSSKHFTISVSDNGKGFVVNENIFEGHYGLQNMKDRAMESNLSLHINSSPGNGTSIRISV